jgi:hypothetical protein
VKISLPFYKQGQEFTPVLYIKDVRTLEQGIDAAIAAGKACDVWQARANLICAAIRNQDPDFGGDIELSVGDVVRYSDLVYKAGTSPSDDPLAKPGASAAPSS